MDIIMLLLFVLFIVVSFFAGNIMLIAAVRGNNTSDWSEYWLFIFIAVGGDLILLCLAMAKIMPPVSSSFRLMRSGLKNRRIAKKESAKLKKLLKSEKLDVDRLQELRNKKISESDTKRTWHFCQLIETLAGKEQLQDCLSEVREKQSVLDEINDIENRIFKIAESYKNAGDIKQCKYYLDILKSTKITTEITSLENECEEQLLWRERESKAIWLWVKVFLGISAILIAVFAAYYIEDTPYRELRSMIKDQTLTAEMCNRKNKNGKESYYDYLSSDKGRNLIASELTQLHRDDDVIKAMWLLCIQPNSVNGYDLWASPSFIEWLLGYAKNNGVRSVEERAYGGEYVTYTVDGYQIMLDSYDDKKPNISNILDFTVSDGENEITVDNWSRYNNTIPAIE